jgi:hypothetical protein
MTFLWIGLALVGLFLVFFGWLVALGLLDRRADKREVARDVGPPTPFLRSRFEPFVPPQQPCTPWSETERLREPESEQDPDL